MLGGAALKGRFGLFYPSPSSPYPPVLYKTLLIYNVGQTPELYATYFFNGKRLVIFGDIPVALQRLKKNFGKFFNNSNLTFRHR